MKTIISQVGCFLVSLLAFMVVFYVLLAYTDEIKQYAIVPSLILVVALIAFIVVFKVYLMVKANKRRNSINKEAAYYAMLMKEMINS